MKKTLLIVFLFVACLVSASAQGSCSGKIQGLGMTFGVNAEIDAHWEPQPGYSPFGICYVSINNQRANVTSVGLTNVYYEYGYNDVLVSCSGTHSYYFSTTFTNINSQYDYVVTGSIAIEFSFKGGSKTVRGKIYGGSVDQKKKEIPIA